jgi:HprK-related kinase A
MPSSRPDKTQHFRIGVVPVSITSVHRNLLNQYVSLYGHWSTEKPADRTIRIDVSRRPFSAVHRRRFFVTVNDRVRFEPARADETLPYVEWAVNWEIPKVFPEYLQLHASSLQMDGVGVILPGTSGSGKSTLTAGLLARGASYLCDEFALIHAGTLQLHPFPKAICIKKPSYAALESVGLKLHENQHYYKKTKGYVGFVNPVGVHARWMGRPCSIRYVIFPRYVEGAEPQLNPMSRAEAAFALHEVCFNLLGCTAVGLDVIVNMIRAAECYQLVSGEIRSTCALLERLVRSGKGISAQATNIRIDGLADRDPEMRRKKCALAARPATDDRDCRRTVMQGASVEES